MPDSWFCKVAFFAVLCEPWNMPCEYYSRARFFCIAWFDC